MLHWPDIQFGPVNLWTISKQREFMTTEYEEGRLAFFDGYALSENPYDSDETAKAKAADWEEGWVDADEEDASYQDSLYDDWLFEEDYYDSDYERDTDDEDEDI